MSFVTTAAHAAAMADSRPAIALVTGGRSGIGKAIVNKIAEFPFIDQVLAVSRSITDKDVNDSPNISALAADVTTQEGRQVIVDRVHQLCRGDKAKNKQLRFIIHSAGSIDPIKPVLEVTSDELRHAMVVNCEAPLLLSIALYPYMEPLDSNGVAGRILHVSSGAAHGAPPLGWSCYGISKAAFFQSFKCLEREFREAGGGKVVVGSFKPGVIDTAMQLNIRESTMPAVSNFQRMKQRADEFSATTRNDKARPPPKGALDTPENVAFFVEWLLLGTTDEEFANKDDSNEYDIRNAGLYTKWISQDVLDEVE